MSDLREVSGDVWDWYARGYWVAVPTNGTVRKDGACVMGRGLALQAARRFPGFQAAVGTWLGVAGNRVGAFPAWRLFSFPVKDNWREPVLLQLIARSVQDLTYARHLLARYEPQLAALPVVLPHVGCGNGGLRWELVRLHLWPLGGRDFLVVDNTEGA